MKSAHAHKTISDYVTESLKHVFHNWSVASNRKKKPIISILIENWACKCGLFEFELKPLDGAL